MGHLYLIYMWPKINNNIKLWATYKYRTLKGGDMLIGRVSEKALLEKCYTSTESEFMVVYGRRRIGKTYLIKEFFSDKKGVFFHATGLQFGNTKKQLQNFSTTIAQVFFDDVVLTSPKDWGEAFALLHKQIIKVQTKQKVIIFLDELPWMATRKSGLLQEIDYYWNHYWSSMKNVFLILCGSSASWLMQKIIYNRGGLHNRLTAQIGLKPFSLFEVQQYLKSRKIKLNHQHILSLYLALGGVPYYLRYVEPGLTAEQNIQKLFFETTAPLQDEFTKLFESLFENADSYIELVKLIGEKQSGLTRAALQSLAKLSSGGGRLSRRLQDLCETGFLKEYTPYGKEKGEYYKLVDEFCLFFLHWVEAEKNRSFSKNYWLHKSVEPAYHAWAGCAFEMVCIKHINQIVDALGVQAKTTSAWRVIPKNPLEEGAQIDLVVDRYDEAVTLCEIKYTTQPFVLDKAYAKQLDRKAAIFGKRTRTNKQIFWALISANGVKDSFYTEELLSRVVTLEDLFKSA